MNIELLRSTFAAAAVDADLLTTTFYDLLFKNYPQARPLFAETDFAEQKKKLAQAVAAVVALVDRPDELLPVLDKLGASHKTYGAEAEHYGWVKESLMLALAGQLDDRWTSEAESTWSDALDFVAGKMIEAQDRLSSN